ncbi:MAG: molybdopterin-guanine dinucleotide biosynthesis protein B, partial [Dehalococcoidales bacterium]|nr:molybdopterin-guanine dinucleotide biosynthesis protein B [Dehalococcoidales bacterium]
MMRMTKVVSFVGYSNSGKTTLLEKVINELKGRGYRVGVIKHTSKACEIDIPGKDTWRYAQAGSNIVVLSSQTQMAVLEKI